MNKKKMKLVIALFVVLGGIGLLIVTSMGDAITYYMTPSEILAKAGEDADAVYGERVRVGGTVIVNTTKGSAAKRTWEFTITDDRDIEEMELVSLKDTVPEDRIKIKYSGILPDTFQDGVLAIVDGSLDENNVFLADSVLAKCPSKYEATDQDKEDMAEKGRADREAGRNADKVKEQ